eukprot:IDg22988t1
MSRLDSDSHTVVEVDDEIPSFLLETNGDGVLTIDEPLPDPPEALQLVDVLRGYSKDLLCQKILDTINMHEAPYLAYDEQGVLVRRVTNRDQIVVLESMQDRLINIAHTPITAGHPSERCMYSTMRRKFYWPRMALDIHIFVRNCPQCARERIKLRRYANPLRLFRQKGPCKMLQ